MHLSICLAKFTCNSEHIFDNSLLRVKSNDLITGSPTFLRASIDRIFLYFFVLMEFQLKCTLV